MSKFVLLLLLPLLLASVRARDRTEYVDDWLQAGRIVSKYAWPHREPFIRLLRSLLSKENVRNRINSECTSSLTSFANRLSTEEEDAMLLFDSFAKVSPGLLGDRLQDFGHYSQCLKSTFAGRSSRYALLALHWPMPDVQQLPSTTTLAISAGHFDQLARGKSGEANYTSHWIGKFNRNIDSFTMYPQLLAVCVPSTCSNSDISGLLNELCNKTSPLSVSLYSSETLAEDSFAWYNGSKIQIVSRITLALVILLTLVSTALCTLNPAKWKESFFSHFDAKSHTARLFSFPDSSVIRRTEFISGYKGLYLITGISNHAYMPLTPAIAFHYVPIHSLEISDPVWNTFQKAMATFNINVTVSAMLNSISWIEQLERSKGKTTFALFLLLRILRTLPITIVVLLVMYSFPLLPTGSGPLVDKAQHFMLSNCLNNGWKELLFISNFQKIGEICYPVGWYLSADLQLYILSYIPLIALAIKPKVGFVLLLCQMLIGMLMEAFVITWKDIYPALPMMNIPSMEGVFRALNYTHSYTHNYIACYAIGLAGGYLIIKSPSINISKRKMAQFVGIIFISLIPTYLALKNYDGCVFKYSRIYEVTLASIFRSSQSISFCLFSFLLSYFPSSIVAKFLSNPVLLLSSRMSFSMFMIHPIVMALLFSSRSDTDYSRSYYTMFILFVFALSFVLGYIMVVCVEYPFNSLLRSTLKSLMTKKARQSDNEVAQASKSKSQ